MAYANSGATVRFEHLIQLRMAHTSPHMEETAVNCVCMTKKTLNCWETLECVEWMGRIKKKMPPPHRHIHTYSTDTHKWYFHDHRMRTFVKRINVAHCDHIICDDCSLTTSSFLSYAYWPIWHTSMFVFICHTVEIVPQQVSPLPSSLHTIQQCIVVYAASWLVCHSAVCS